GARTVPVVRTQCRELNSKVFNLAGGFRDDEKPATQADDKPITTAVLPPPPDVTGAAAALWSAIITGMAAQRTLSAEALPCIERYCLVTVRWRTAEQHLAAEGEVTAAKRTGVPAVNPWLGISRTAASQLT